METHQYTVKRPAHCSGTGLHTGKTVSLSIFPAPINHGIVFTRTDLLSRPAIPAKYDRVVGTTLATTLGDSQCQISTVEHLMAALHALGIDNAQVEVDAQELPIMDGSSWPFVELLNEGFGVIPSLKGIDQVEKTLGVFDNLVIMKVGSHVKEVYDLLVERGMENNALIISNVGMDGEYVGPLIPDREYGYFTTMIIKSEM